jgi:trans-aconitate 2-methyltransferase
MTDTWNPLQYDKFQREREQPFFDLLAMVRPAAAMRIVDLGCGTGRLTEIVHDRLHARETLGLDRSPNMLKTRIDSPLPPGLHFEVGAIEDFPAGRGRFDLIFSNAALHWVEDHETLLGRLAGALSPGGQLAFQVPAQHAEASHVTACELARVEPFRTALNGWERAQPVLEPEAYARILHRLGFADPKVCAMIYPHVLQGPEDVVEWVKGTLLTEYMRHLPADLHERFLERYRSMLLERLEPARPYFYPFKRILGWAQRAA